MGTNATILDAWRSVGTSQVDVKPRVSMAKNKDASRTAIEPRCLSKVEVAGYCNITTRNLKEWVRRRILPGPIPGTHRWDRKAVDLALDKQSGLVTHKEQPEDAFNAWKRKRDEDRFKGHALGST